MARLLISFPRPGRKVRASQCGVWERDKGYQYVGACKSFTSLPSKVAPHCKFSTITVNGGKLATVLTENPAGCVLPLDHKLVFQN